jgi:hypothetical protein
MTKAWKTPPKVIRLANGARLTMGQLIGGDPMKNNPQRPLNSASPMKSLNIVNVIPPAPVRSRTQGEGIAHTGAPKNIPDAPTMPGQKRRTSGELHPYLHGQPLNDEAETPMKHSQIVAPPAHGTTAKQRAEHASGPSGNQILTDAGNLGRKA